MRLTLHCTQIYVLLACCLFGQTTYETFYERLFMSCLLQSCTDCVYLWNDCQALVSSEAYVSLMPGLPARQEPGYKARPMS